MDELSSRKRKENIDSPVSNPEFDEISNVTGLLSERIENLVQAIDEIDTALIERKVLNKKFLEQIEEEREEIKRHLNFLNESLGKPVFTQSLSF